ncbi:MAG TPA: methyltransferase domain-containing protein [Chloroflexota bacterium]|nr:methyltransferase domain-containing protein [Chloroflexota bacterium]
MPNVVLSYLQAESILAGKKAGKSSLAVSLDLGLTRSEVSIDATGVTFPNAERLTWNDLDAIRGSETKCFVVEQNALREIRTFSRETDRVYSLMPGPSAPTLLLSGISMHRIKNANPHDDTLSKIRAAAPMTGRVLDTATGLGYTAIEAARTAEQVITVELDPAVLDVARQNPWSKALFDNPRISQRIGDSFAVIQQFDDEAFTRVVHDPPTFSLAGELYSGEFYRQAFRVLRRGGRLFHYIGNPETRSGHAVTAGVIRRLQDAGFTRVVRRPEAFGVVAYK